MRIKGLLKRILGLNQKQPTFVEHDGVELDLSSSYISEGMRSQILRAYETAEVDLLKKHLKKENKVLELGMGIGFLGIYSKKVVGVSLFVGVEADEKLLPIIEQNAKRNSVELKVIIGVVDNQNGETEFNISENFWSNSVLTRADSEHKRIVPTLSYDEILKQAGFMPDFLLMDIEGAELEIDFKEYGKHTEKLLIELHPHIYGTEKASQTINNIMVAGFQLVDYQENVFLFGK